MVYLCIICTDPPGCQKNPPEECLNKMNCQCKCNVGGKWDVTEKIFIIGSGLTYVGCGIALTILTGGVAGVLFGGAVLGAGMSSTVYGTTKAIKKERIDPKSYFIDVGVGALTGVVTGGIGAAGEVAATSTVKCLGTELVNAGVTKMVVRTTTGAVAGVTSKVIDDIKNCELDRSLGSWVTSAAVGAIGGAGSHVSSNVTKIVPSGATKSIVRASVSATTATVADVTLQHINIATGNQDKYNFKQTATSAVASGITTAAQEGIKNGIYRANGGKDVFLHEKTNEKLIKEKFPENIQKYTIDGYENLKLYPQDYLEYVAETSYQNKAQYEQQRETRRIEIEKIQKDFTTRSQPLEDELKTAVGDRKKQITKDLKDLRTQQNNANAAVPKINQPKTLIIDQERNTHFLTGDKKGQIAFDIPTPINELQHRDTARGQRRAILDFDAKAPRGTELKFVSYIDDHDYKRAPNYGQGDYCGTRDIYNRATATATLNSNFTSNQLIQNEFLLMSSSDEEK